MVWSRSSVGTVSTRRAWAAAMVVAGLLAASCSDGSGSAGSTPPQDTTSVSVVPSSDPVVTTPVTDVPEVPQVPAGVNWVASAVVSDGDVAPLPSFADVTATAGVPAPPAGYPFQQSLYTLVRWDAAGVTFVSAGCSCWQGGSSSGVTGRLRAPQYLFRSDNGGASWTQVDLAPALGNGNGFLDDIIEVDGALLLQATIADDSRTQPSVIVVAKSVDGGVTWERLTALTGESDGRMSLFGDSFGVVGGNLVLVGADVVCDFDGNNAVQSVGTSLQTRLWTSSDGGLTWVAQAKADTALDSKPAPPADATGCATLDLQARIDQYSVTPRTIEFQDDTMFVWSQDGSKMASSSDGLSWSTATLEGAAPVPVEFVDTVANSDAAAVVATADGFVAVNLEVRRTAADEATFSGSSRSVVAWLSADGATWERLPSGRPLSVGDARRFRFVPTEASIGLVALPSTACVLDPARCQVAGGASEVQQAWESVAGPAEEWVVCAAAAGANCAYAETLTGVEPGVDLSGINLTGVVLQDLDLTDVSFADAEMVNAGIVGSVLDGTDFSRANLSLGTLRGDLSTAILDGTNLTNGFITGEFFAGDYSTAILTDVSVFLDGSPLPAGTSFAGMDLTGWSFDSYDAQADMTGVDFSGANLTDVSVSGVDLTGAVFTGANLTNVYFSEFGQVPVTCPDGQPVLAGSFGPAACRLPAA